jgi:hypothetical protein
MNIHAPIGDNMGRKLSLGGTIDIEVYIEMRDMIKQMGGDPDATGVQAHYIEDAIKGKNMLIKNHKWLSADDINPEKAKLQ